MTLQANSYALRFGAGKYAQAASTIRQGANRFKTMAHQMQQGRQGWQGDAASAFLAKCDMLHSDYMKTSDALDRISSALNTLAAKIDHINELRNQAKFMTDRMSFMTVKTDGDRRAMEDIRRQASSIAYSAEMEARAADEVAASMFNEIATVERSLQSLSKPSNGRGHQGPSHGFEDLPEPYRSYYQRHPELYQDPDQTLPVHIDRDMFFMRLNGMSRDELISILKDQLRNTEVPGYITNQKDIDEIVDSAFDQLYGDLTDRKDYLITAIKTNVLTAENNEEITKKIQAGEDIDLTSTEGFDFVMSQGWEPTGASGDGLISMSTGGLLQKYAPKDSKVDKIEGKSYDYFDTKAKHEEEDDGALNTAKRNQYKQENAEEDLHKIEDAQSSAEKLNNREGDHITEAPVSHEKVDDIPPTTPTHDAPMTEVPKGRFTKSQFEGKSLTANMETFLAKFGLTVEEFNILRLKPLVQGDPLKKGEPYTPKEAEQMRQIRAEIPMPDKGTILQKIITIDKLKGYLSREITHDTIGGCVARFEDVSYLSTSNEIMEALRLDYEGSEFLDSNLKYKNESVGAIRFKALDTAQKLFIPTEGDPPMTNNGFSGSELGHQIPEYKFNGYPPLPDGAELYEITTDGTEILRGVWSDELKSFIPVGK